jgi:hypothetical protein
MEPTPLRPNGDVGLQVTLGGEAYSLPVLSMRRNRDWLGAFSGALTGMVNGIGEPKTLDEVASVIASYATSYMDILIAYDYSGVLPDREWIDTHATDREVYEAIRNVSEVAAPFGSNLLGLALMQAEQKVRASLTRSSGRRPSTDGPPKKSKAA